MPPSQFSMVSEKFTEALQAAGLSADRFTISYNSELVDEEDYLSFLINVKVKPFTCEEGEIDPPPVVFQIDYLADVNEAYFIVGEDTQKKITYGNVYAYMYFSMIYPAQ